MTSQHPDTTPHARTYRLRAALSAALLPLLAALLVLGLSAPAEAATAAKRSARIIEPTSVTVASTTCTELSDGTWNVTVTFAVSGGRYLNLGRLSESAKARRGHYDNVRGGGIRYVEGLVHHFGAYPGFDDDHSIPVTYGFYYQQAVAPITAQRAMFNRSAVRHLSRLVDVAFTCA